MLNLQKGRRINNRYSIISFLTQWDGANVYLVTDESTNTEVFLKIYPIIPIDNNVLPNEFNYDNVNRRQREFEYLELCQNQNIPNFPRVIESFQFANRDALVLTKHGETLKDILYQNVSKFSMRNTVRIGWRLFALISKVHESGYLHRGLTPSTIMGGFDEDGTFTFQLYGFDYAKPMNPAPASIGMSTQRYQSLQVSEGEAYHCLDDYMSILFILMESQTIRPFNMNHQTMLERKRAFDQNAYDWMTEEQYWMADLHTVLVDQRESGFHKFQILKCLREAITGFDPRTPIQYTLLPGDGRDFINLNVAEGEAADQPAPRFRNQPIRVPQGF